MNRIERPETSVASTAQAFSRTVAVHPGSPCRRISPLSRILHGADDAGVAGHKRQLAFLDLDIGDRVAPGELHQSGAAERPGQRRPFASRTPDKQLAGSRRPRLLSRFVNQGPHRRCDQFPSIVGEHKAGGDERRKVKLVLAPVAIRLHLEADRLVLAAVEIGGCGQAGELAAQRWNGLDFRDGAFCCGFDRPVVRDENVEGLCRRTHRARAKEPKQRLVRRRTFIGLETQARPTVARLPAAMSRDTEHRQESSPLS